MSENKLMNLSSKKRLYHILVFTIIIISSLPISIQILLYDIDHNADNFYSTIIINSFYYQVLYNLFILFYCFLQFMEIKTKIYTYNITIITHKNYYNIF